MAKRQDSDREVLTSLPRSRPVRRSAKRADRPAAVEAVEPTPKAPAKPRAARAASAVNAAPGSPAKAAGPRAEKPAATSTANRTPKPTAVPTDARAAPRRKVPAAGYAAPNTRTDESQASAGAELISTTIQAAAELAQIGLTVGRQTLQSMLDRLPKP